MDWTTGSPGGAEWIGPFPVPRATVEIQPIPLRGPVSFWLKLIVGVGAWPGRPGKAVALPPGQDFGAYCPCVRPGKTGRANV